MESKDFQSVAHKVFKNNGFDKIKSRYYRKGKQFLCEIQLQKSCYSSAFYVNFDFFLGEFDAPYIINRDCGSSYTPFVGGRFYFGEEYGYLCEYSNWSEDQLLHILLENMDKSILPPFTLGKQYLQDHYGSLYKATLNIAKSEALLFSEQ